MKKRVLVITYYWPPSGGSGVQRWLKFAKYLPEAGWEPVIFTPENPDFDLKDTSLLKEVSSELEVIRFPIWEPYQLFSKITGKSKNHPGRILEQEKKGILGKIAIWMRANLLVPDPRVFWVKPSVSFLKDLIQTGQFQAIITTGPPHSLHLIGLRLKQKTGVFWLADFRDPWSEWEFLDSLPMASSVRKKHVKLEQAVLQHANVVTTISPTFQQDLARIGNRTVFLLTNGYDPVDIPIDFVAQKKKAGKLRLLYTGIIDSIRNPIPLLEALKAEFEQKSEDVEMSFVGKVSDELQKFVNQDSWLVKRIHFRGYVSHLEVFEFYAHADVLVLVLTDTKNAQGNIPGKLFEYLATGVTVLALGDPTGDSAAILKDAGSGSVISHADREGIRRRLREIFESDAVEVNLGNLEKYSRRNLSFQLSGFLEQKD